MRLKGGDDAPVREARARAGQGRLDLRRVMTVVVDDGDAVRFAAHGEATLHALEVAQRLDRGRKRNAELVRDRATGERVEHVVRAHHLEHHFAEPLGPVEDGETRLECAQLHVVRAPVGLRRDAVRHVPLGQPRDQMLHDRMVDAHHGETVERLLQRVDSAVVVEVLGIDVGDHRDGRREA